MKIKKGFPSEIRMFPDIYKYLSTRQPTRWQFVGHNMPVHT